MLTSYLCGWCCLDLRVSFMMAKCWQLVYSKSRDTLWCVNMSSEGNVHAWLEVRVGRCTSKFSVQVKLQWVCIAPSLAINYLCALISGPWTGRYQSWMEWLPCPKFTIEHFPPCRQYMGSRSFIIFLFAIDWALSSSCIQLQPPQVSSSHFRSATMLSSL